VVLALAVGIMYRPGLSPPAPESIVPMDLRPIMN